MTRCGSKSVGSTAWVEDREARGAVASRAGWRLAADADTGKGDEDLAAYCRDRLARHKVPKLWHRTDALPLTGSGKVMKHVLREQLSHQDKPA